VDIAGRAIQQPLDALQSHHVARHWSKHLIEDAYISHSEKYPESALKEKWE